jgi:hypothetical protein
MIHVIVSLDGALTPLPARIDDYSPITNRALLFTGTKYKRWYPVERLIDDSGGDEIEKAIEKLAEKHNAQPAIHASVSFAPDEVWFTNRGMYRISEGGYRTASKFRHS